MSYYKSAIKQLVADHERRIAELEKFVQQVADHSNDTWLVQWAIRLGAQL